MHATGRPVDWITPLFRHWRQERAESVSVPAVGVHVPIDAIRLRLLLACPKSANLDLAERERPEVTCQVGVSCRRCGRGGGGCVRRSRTRQLHKVWNELS